jgi:hypothetical protein
MVPQGKDLDVGQAEARKFLRGFRLHILGLWLGHLIEGVGLEVTIANCERRGCVFEVQRRVM